MSSSDQSLIKASQWPRKSEKRRAKVHWQSPTVMASSFASGVLLAMGHHLFYNSLDQVRVDEAKYSQEMNIRIGTGMSYLVRAFLVISVGTAYWQIFWRTLLRKQLPTSAIDSLGALLGNFFGFFDMTALRANAVLFPLAIVSWLIPFAAIVPPATLSVSLVHVTSHEMRPIPNLNWRTGPGAAIEYSGYGVGGPNAGNISAPPEPSYSGPSAVLSRLAMSNSMQGHLPTLPAPAVNSSYRLSFPAPKVECKPAAKGTMSHWDDAISELYGIVSMYYLAWVPSGEDIVPFNNDTIYDKSASPFNLMESGGTSLYLGARTYTPKSLDSGTIQEPASLFVATKPSGGSLENWSVTNCSLWNASYEVDFKFENGDQHLSVHRAQRTHPVSVDSIDDWSYNGEAFNYANHGSRLNYQALMECLGKLLVGSSMMDQHAQLSATGNFLQSEIAYAQELFRLYKARLDESDGSDTYNITVLDAEQSSSFNRSLGDVIEQTFQNMTLSLFSRQAFLTDATAPTNVTIHSVTNIYSYTSTYLFLACGLAILFSLLAVLLGSMTIWRAQASYSNKFSTIMRTTCGPETGIFIPRNDRAGQDPLMKDLAEQRIQVGAGADVQPAQYITLHRRPKSVVVGERADDW